MVTCMKLAVFPTAARAKPMPKVYSCQNHGILDSLCNFFVVHGMDTASLHDVQVWRGDVIVPAPDKGSPEGYYDGTLSGP